MIRIPRRWVVLGTLVLFFVVAVTYADDAVPSTAESGELASPIHLTMMVVYASIAIFFSFLCSIAEAVVLCISSSYIANMERTKKRTADRLRGIKTNIDRTLAAILTLNTIAHTLGAGGAGAEAAAYFGDDHVGIAMTILTLLILFLSEIIPKTLGAMYWRKLAPLTARFVRVLVFLLFPLIFVSEYITKWLSRGKSMHHVSRDEFTAMADVGEEAGHLDAQESTILRNLFRLSELCAEDIMTPRTVVFALQQDRTVAEVIAEHAEISFSRIPVYANNQDEVTGFVLKTDLLLNQFRNEGVAKLRDLKREIRGVDEKATLGKVLEQLLDHRAHLMLVVDQYGGMEGIVTLEDVVETLIGSEIVDEADKIDDMRRLARQKWEERMRRTQIDILETDDPKAENQKTDNGGTDDEHS